MSNTTHTKQRRTPAMSAILALSLTLAVMPGHAAQNATEPQATPQTAAAALSAKQQERGQCPHAKHIPMNKANVFIR